MEDNIRKVNYGRFVDFMPPELDYDSGLIGGHIYQRNAEEASLKTASCEYYITKDGSKITIYDSSLLEKISACIKFVFKPKKKRVLGVRYDKDGKLVVDEDYYNFAEQRAVEREDRTALK